MAHRKYTQVLNAITADPWHMTFEGLTVLMHIVESRLDAGMTNEEIAQQIGRSRESRRAATTSAGAVRGVGILPLHGPIFPKANMMTEMSGATSMESFSQDFRMLMKDEDVHSVLIDVDSPGGSAKMLNEVAAEIRAARGIKPIIAVANTDANSGAYYIASQADQFYATPSGFVGSIGTYLVHEDHSEELANKGVKLTAISAGRRKMEGNQFEPLSEEGLAHRQNVVDQLNDQFVEAVALGRGISEEEVRSNYGEGAVLTAKDALDRGMIDGIETFDSVLGSMLSSGNAKASSGSNAFAHSLLAGSMNPVQESQSGARSSVVDWEHSEPGTGPQPVEDEEEDPPGQGTRGNSAPVEDEERTAMADLDVKALREKLELNDDGDVLAAVDSLLAEVAPIRSASTEANKALAFSQQFPEEYAELQKLQQTRVEGNATSFASKYEKMRMTKGEGDSAEETPFGFTTVTVDAIKEAHAAMANGEIQETHLSAILDTVMNNGLVEFGERGNSLIDDELHGEAKPKDASLQFAEAVKEVMVTDGLDAASATNQVAATKPHLFNAYREYVESIRER